MECMASVGSCSRVIPDPLFAGDEVEDSEKEEDGDG